jgi:hypothetical protein
VLKFFADKVAKSEVCDTSRVVPWYTIFTIHPTGEHGGAERRLREERLTFTRFDTELRELDELIKAKKQAASDAEVAIKKLDHETRSRLLLRKRLDTSLRQRTSRSSMSGSRRKASR